ncbi:MAG: FTR1 family protein, partial [Pseudomonadota bacterium]
MDTVSVAFQSGTILLREGLESILVIAALAAFLIKMNAASYVKYLYSGAAAAVVASLFAAAVFMIFFNGGHSDQFEAVVMFVAAALMIYVSGWMFLRQNPRAWKAELERSAQHALETHTWFPIAAIAFFAVFREGAET